jgi:23S rRNA pseudouridine1911/1915/1917 synthase
MTTLVAGSAQRLDQYLVRELPQYSRSRLQDWIRQGRVTVDGTVVRKASYALRGGERIGIEAAPRAPLAGAVPEEIPLEILYEDAHLVAVNKPAGMTVHAGAGVREGTLVNALLHRYQQLSTVNGEERPGIVHRLDRFTSGVILVARTDEAHRNLAAQFASRQTKKTYFALVHGGMEHDSGTLDRPIARHSSQRHKMITGAGGRAALTEWRVLERFPAFTLLEVRIHTGRTHQIRVHLASLRHPVAGDRTYGAPANQQAERAGGRFFLHAAKIGFRHPGTGEPVDLTAPLPPQLNAWLESLRARPDAPADRTGSRTKLPARDH